MGILSNIVAYSVSRRDGQVRQALQLPAADKYCSLQARPVYGFILAASGYSIAE
jgi:hypothetical protein